MYSITLATVFLENLSKFCINLQRKSESQKICCLHSSCTANMHKVHESIKITAISGAQKGGALGQGENVCASDSPASVFSKLDPVQAFPPQAELVYAVRGLQFITQQLE